MVTDRRPDLFGAVLNGRLEIKKLKINMNLGTGRVRLFPPATTAALNSHAEGQIFRGNDRLLIRRR